MKLKHFGMALGLAGVLAGCSSSTTSAPLKVQHVLLISVDGMHEVDLSSWIAGNPTSNLAQLAQNAVVYTAANTTTPSDSFPGMLALVTGGTPKSTGVYYDDSYDRTLYPPGSNCKSIDGGVANPGTEVVQDETIDFDLNQLFSGGINPQNLAMQLVGGSCTPVFPHNFVKVNTAFEVVKAAGGHTAWSDKHPAYDLLNGPSGTGIDDLYTPEINSLIVNGGTVNGVALAASLSQCNATNSLSNPQVYTDCLPACEAYDDVKVQAVLNWIAGLKSDGGTGPGVPVLFGMNFQEVSVGQKLPIGGYVDAGTQPSAQLNGALAHVDGAIGKMVAALKAANLFTTTAIIITAKHGQAPINYNKLAMEAGAKHAPVQTVQDPLGFINATDAGANVDQVTWTNNNTSSPTVGQQYAVEYGHFQTDDVGILWLQNSAPAGVAEVAAELNANLAAINADTLPPGTLFASSITSGSALAAIYGDPASTDPIAAARAPNIFIQPNLGTIYSGSSKKIAEHGGGSLDDKNVGLMVAWPSLAPATISTAVSTTQVAPTILQALGYQPSALQSVQKEGTTVLPGLF